MLVLPRRRRAKAANLAFQALHGLGRRVKRFRPARLLIRVSAISVHLLFGRARVVSLGARTHRNVSTPPCSATAVCHVYYPELFDELFEAANRAPFVKRLVVTCPHEKYHVVSEKIVACEKLNPHILMTVVAHENSGKDIVPFLRVLQHPWVQAADLVLKIHSKRSPHLPPGKGEHWRKSLLHGLSPLLESHRERLTHVLVSASSKSEPHLVWPARWAYSVESWGSNRATAMSLIRGHRHKTYGPIVFPAGSMFWCNRAFVSELSGLNTQIDLQRFASTEPLLDGTLAHGIERFIGLLAIASGRISLTV